MELNDLGETMTTIYLVNNKVICSSGAGHWGDYAYILWEGFAPEDKNGNTYIERTGPFVPEIYIASSTLICTDAAKAFLSDAAPGLTFSVAEKKKIVNVQWTSWDKDREIDAYIDFESIDEPEDIIENGVHNHGVAASMPKLWRVGFSSAPKVKIKQLGKFNSASPYSHLAASALPPAPDFLLAEGDGYLGLFTSEDGMRALSRTFGDFLNFVEIPVA
jgi:hypothetical protein